MERAGKSAGSHFAGINTDILLIDPDKALHHLILTVHFLLNLNVCFIEVLPRVLFLAYVLFSFFFVLFSKVLKDRENLRRVRRRRTAGIIPGVL